MLVLGIDPGTATTGFCVLSEIDKKVTVLSCGAIKTPKTEPQHKRLSMIHERVTDIISKYKPDSMAVEKLFFGTNTKTAMKVGEARGTILLAASECGLDLAEYSPMDVKIALTGYGKADKNQVQQMVKRLLGLKEIPKPDDAADAAAIALCHINTSGFNVKISRQERKI